MLHDYLGVQGLFAIIDHHRKLPVYSDATDIMKNANTEIVQFSKAAARNRIKHLTFNTANCHLV